MKNLKKTIVGIVGASMLAGTSFVNPIYACEKSKQETFLSVILPAIKNPRDIYTDKDGKIYVNFSSDLNTINEISARPENFKRRITGRESIYQTIEELRKNNDPTSKYIIEINVDEGLRKGFASKAYNKNGKELESSAYFRCYNSPLKFWEKK
jgi:hypothetical protein